eukprot:COSAG02_NODE_10390_length_1951_cov_1.954644_3_plen_182_part_00
MDTHATGPPSQTGTAFRIMQLTDQQEEIDRAATSRRPDPRRRGWQCSISPYASAWRCRCAWEAHCRGSERESRAGGEPGMALHKLLLLPLLALLVKQSAGHGAMTFPKPRNAYDGELSPWSDWGYPCDNTHQDDNCTITGVVGLDAEHFAQIGGACSISAHKPGAPDALNASNGQACYWFS